MKIDLHSNELKLCRKSQAIPTRYMLYQLDYNKKSQATKL